ncbi:MAG: hypothetical protein E7448_06780 [Ruminococcaceae bacterium]|nr:hypothetical protein [Oscillospiraceae bacterium]
MNKKIVSIFLALALVIAFLPGVSLVADAASATDLSTWVEEGRKDLTDKKLAINDAKDFRHFQLEMCKYGRTFEGYTIYLNADIDLNPGWNSPVSLKWENGQLTADSVQTATAPEYALPAIDTENNAGKSKQFGGVFDGQGHSISGLYLSLNAGNAASLFGQVIGSAEVKNLAVLDSCFANGGTDLTASKPLAGIFTNVPTGTTATISNCYIDIDLYEKSTSKSGNLHAKFGGLVGYSKGTLVVKDTVYAGSMSFNMAATQNRLDNAGGIVGLVEGTSAAAANVTVQNFVFAGTIYSPYQRVAGGIGRSQNRANITMTNCLNLGRIYGAYNTAGLAASVLVQGDGVVQNITMTDCYSVKTDISRILAPAGNHNGTCSVTATVNGEQKYKLDSAGTVGSEFDESFAISVENYTGLTAEATLAAQAIGGNGGYLSDVFAATSGCVAPKALSQLFGAKIPTISATFTDAAYDKDDIATELKVTASNSAVTYQWYCGGEAVEGATSATYTPSTAEAGNYTYSCVVTATKTGVLGTTIATATTNTVKIHVHDWTSGSCTEPKHCNVAECPTIIDTPDHAFDNDCTTADKCANCDAVATANDKHSFDADCTTADKCVNCKEMATANPEHIYTDDKDADCNADGCTATRVIRNPNTGDVALGFVIVAMVLSVVMLVVLVPKKRVNQ